MARGENLVKKISVQDMKQMKFTLFEVNKSYKITPR